MRVSTGSTGTTRALTRLFELGLVTFGSRTANEGRLRQVVLTPLGQAEQVRLRSQSVGVPRRAAERFLWRWRPDVPVWAWERRAT